jgi:hypothetical protein
MNFFYTDKAGDVAGPISQDELRDLIDSHNIGPEAKICAEGTEQWVAVGEFRKKPQTVNSDPKPKNPALAKSKRGLARYVYASAVTFLLAFACFKLNEVSELLNKQKTPPLFEYAIVAPNDEVFEFEMNMAGKAGWEIVSARRATSKRDVASYEVIMKRQKK